MDLLIFLAEAGHGEHAWYIDPHGFGLVFWTGLTFMLVMGVLYWKAWAPLMDALEARERGIEGQVAEARRIRDEAERVKAQYEEKLDEARLDAQKIIAEGEDDKKRIIDEAHAKAAAEVEEIKARAERDLQQAKAKALAELKQSAVVLGMAIAEKVIAAEVSADKHKALVDEILTSYERR